MATGIGEQRFLDLIEANADAIVVVDGDGDIQFVNRAAERLFRKERAELLGTVFGFPLVSGETTELDLAMPGDRPVVVEMRVVQSEWQGEPVRIASLRDITERKQAERSARQLIQEQAARSAAEAAARRFQFLAESSTTLSASLDRNAVLTSLAELCVKTLADWVVIYVVAPDGQVGRLEVVHREQDAHPALSELRDRPIDADGGHPVLDVVRRQEPFLMRDVDEADLACMAQDPRHLEILRELGLASCLLVPLVARDRSVGAIGLVSSSPDRQFDQDDVTLASDLAHRAALAVDNARLYNEAREADREKSHLLAVISHDLKTPLSSIIGYADLLTSGIPEPLPAAHRGHVDRIRIGATHLLHLINELLAFARLDAGQAELDLQPVAIQDVVREVADVLQPLACNAGLDLEIRLPDEPETLRTDPGKLRQILLNLAGNAIKFTGQGSVSIAVEPIDGHVHVHVRDTGVGIAAGDLEQIFQPFWRVDEQAAEGSGLGLSVVQRLTSMLGGEILVDSQPGLGTTFTVSIPRQVLD